MSIPSFGKVLVMVFKWHTHTQTCTNTCCGLQPICGFAGIAFYRETHCLPALSVCPVLSVVTHPVLFNMLLKILSFITYHERQTDTQTDRQTDSQAVCLCLCLCLSVRLSDSNTCFLFFCPSECLPHGREVSLTSSESS